MQTPQLKSGYSVVEIIIYVAVFAVVSIIIANAFIVLVSFFNQSRTNHNLLQSGNTALERMSREIHTATAIRTSTSTFGSSPGVLDLDSTDANGNAQTVKFNMASGALNLSYNNTLVDNMLPPNVVVTSLIFYKTTTTNGPSVKIEMALQDTQDKSGLTEQFYNVTALAK